MNKEVKEKTGVGVSDDNAIVEGTSRGESENRGRGDNRGFKRTTVNRPLRETCFWLPTNDSGNFPS